MTRYDDKTLRQKRCFGIGLEPLSVCAVVSPFPGIHLSPLPVLASYLRKNVARRPTYSHTRHRKVCVRGHLKRSATKRLATSDSAVAIPCRCYSMPLLFHRGRSVFCVWLSPVTLPAIQFLDTCMASSFGRKGSSDVDRNEVEYSTLDQIARDALNHATPKVTRHRR